jgi:hypothetical protein
LALEGVLAVGFWEGLIPDIFAAIGASEAARNPMVTLVSWDWRQPGIGCGGAVGWVSVDAKVAEEAERGAKGVHVQLIGLNE